MHPTTLLTKLAYAEALSRAATLRLRSLTEDTDRLVHSYDQLLAHTQDQLQQFGMIYDQFPGTLPATTPCLDDLADRLE